MFALSWKFLLGTAATANAMATTGDACSDSSAEHLSLLQTRSSLVLGTAGNRTGGPLGELGNEVRKRTEYGIEDGSNNMQVVDRGVGPFQEHGLLTSVSFWVGRAGDRGLKFRIWRPTAGGDQFIGETEKIVDIPTVDVVKTHVFSKPVAFLKGDYIGWAHGEMDFVGTGIGNIPYDQSNFPGPGGGDGFVDTKNSAAVPGVDGQAGTATSCAIQTGWFRSPRQYSYKVYYSTLSAAACADAEMCDTECPKDLQDSAAAQGDPAGDQAGAVGDPHVASSTGKHFDIQ